MEKIRKNYSILENDRYAGSVSGNKNTNLTPLLLTAASAHKAGNLIMSEDTDSEIALILLNGDFGICKNESEAKIPKWARDKTFFSITKTENEDPAASAEELIPDGVKSEKGWKCLKFQGPLDLTVLSLLSKISSTLESVGVSIFTVSTHSTDYIFIKENNCKRAIEELEAEEILILRE
ncbi:hypothetical protein J2755_001478 [Methanohalophilus levihalophilus]|nr:hypothetical protein [Methanohalophilus levihalophilus]